MFIGTAVLTWVLLGLVGLAFYFIPTFIALAGEKKNTAAIFVINFFLGWTLLGWVGALVWSLVAPKRPEPVRCKRPLGQVRTVTFERIR